MDLFHALDYGTYSFFHFAGEKAPRVLWQVMAFGDSIGSYLGIVVILVLTAIITPPNKRLRMALVTIAGLLLAAMLIEGLKLATFRPRPGKALESTSSFPSRAVFLGAYAWMMLAYALEWRRRRFWGRVATYLLAAAGIVFVCLSQLWFSQGWVTDVLAGLAGGLGLALLARGIVSADPRASSTQPAA